MSWEAECPEPQDFYHVRTFLQCPYNITNFEVRMSWKVKLFSKNQDVLELSDGVIQSPGNSGSTELVGFSDISAYPVGI